MKSKEAEEISLSLEKSEKILLVSHLNPDGDTIGCALALYHFLVGKGKEVYMVCPDLYPDFLAWMPNVNKMVIADNEFEKAAALFGQVDCIVCVDFNDVRRMGKLAPYYTSSSAIKILFDHHLEPVKFYDYIITNSKASSTSEVIYGFFSQVYPEYKLSLEMAVCLYVGIMTDTGSFSYGCTANTHIIVAGLMESDMDIRSIKYQVYDTYSENRLRLLGLCLSERLVVLPEYQTAYIYLSKEDLKKYDYQGGDSEGYVNFALALKNVRLAAFFIERKEEVKISFRSKGDLAVNTFARKYFNGGGHANASGGQYYQSLEETIAYFKSLLPEFIESDTNK